MTPVSRFLTFDNDAEQLEADAQARRIRGQQIASGIAQSVVGCRNFTLDFQTWYDGMRFAHAVALPIFVTAGSRQIQLNPPTPSVTRKLFGHGLVTVTKWDFRQTAKCLIYWRARHDSNVRLLPSEGSTLSI